MVKIVCSLFLLMVYASSQETIFKDIILPILKIVSSAHISFPTRSQARSVICYKIIDALYVISLRIGFEMTRGHMTFVLQKFFAAFNRVHAHTDEETADLSSEGTMGSPNLCKYEKNKNNPRKIWVGLTPIYPHPIQKKERQCMHCQCSEWGDDCKISTGKTLSYFL